MSVNVRHLLVSTKEMADDLMTQLRGGADFEELASSISMCEFTREEGGKVGWVGKDDDFLDDRSQPSALNPQPSALSPQPLSPSAPQPSIFCPSSPHPPIPSSPHPLYLELDRLPDAARKEALIRKPGDMVVVETSLGHHIVKVCGPQTGRGLGIF